MNKWKQFAEMLGLELGQELVRQRDHGTDSEGVRGKLDLC